MVQLKHNQVGIKRKRDDRLGERRIIKRESSLNTARKVGEKT